MRDHNVIQKFRAIARAIQIRENGLDSINLADIRNDCIEFYEKDGLMAMPYIDLIIEKVKNLNA